MSTALKTRGYCWNVEPNNVECGHSLNMRHGNRQGMNIPGAWLPQGCLVGKQLVIFLFFSYIYFIIFCRTFLRLFYPTNKQNKNPSNFPPWLPSKEYARGYIDYTGFKNSRASFTAAILNYLTGKKYKTTVFKRWQDLLRLLRHHSFYQKDCFLKCTEIWVLHFKQEIRFFNPHHKKITKHINYAYL